MWIDRKRLRLSTCCAATCVLTAVAACSKDGEGASSVSAGQGGSDHGSSGGRWSSTAGTREAIAGAGSAAGGVAGTGTLATSSGSAGAIGTSTGCAMLGESLTTELEQGRWPLPAEYQGGELPQIDLDGPDLNWTYNDPHVLKVADDEWMYASATDYFDFPVRLYRLTSADGQRWRRDPETPVLEPGVAGSFDAGGVETPAVVYFRGHYHLFYTGYSREVDDPAHSVLDYRLGHATSCDGVHFEREGAPLLTPSGDDSEPSNDWLAFVVAEPGPVVVGDELFLYFTALGVDQALQTTLQVIGLIRSSDGTTWSAPELVLRPDQQLYPRAAGWVGYSTPNAIWFNRAVHLFFDVASDPDGTSWRQLRLHHAVSNGGRSDFVHDATPILSAGRFAWITDEVRSPDAVVDRDSLRLYFAGHHLVQGSTLHFGIGMLTAPLLP